MLDQVGEELAAPADAAFEEGEVEIRKAPRHAAQEQPLAMEWPAAAKWPMWLKVKLLGELRRPKPRPPAWKVGAMPSSRHFCQTAS